jgi:hypothetical protein
MKIRINSPTTFVITEQSEKYLETYYFESPIVGNIEVAKSCYPEVRYLGYKTMLFVRGMNKDRDDLTLEVNHPRHLSHILKALEEFCTFNEEPFEIESCIL